MHLKIIIILKLFYAHFTHKFTLVSVRKSAKICVNTDPVLKVIYLSALCLYSSYLTGRTSKWSYFQKDHICFSEAFYDHFRITQKTKIPTCLHFGLPWECSNSVLAWQCSPNAAQCPIHTTNGCILPVSLNVHQAPRLDKKQTWHLSQTDEKSNRSVCVPNLSSP